MNELTGCKQLLDTISIPIITQLPHTIRIPFAAIVLDVVGQAYIARYAAYMVGSRMMFDALDNGILSSVQLCCYNLCDPFQFETNQLEGIVATC